MITAEPGSGRSRRRRRLLRCGEHAVLIEVNGLDEVLALAARIRAAVEAGEIGFGDVVDVVPAATTVLVIVGDDAGVGSLRQRLAELPADPLEVPTESRVVEIPVHYDGPDLEEVAELTGLSRAEAVAAHTGTPWRVAFGGFAPGFAYLSGGDRRLRVPRRAEPRTSVPAGAVALADEYSAVYPRSSPGGWRLLGHTDLEVFDIDRDPPALLIQGVTVRFVDAAERRA